MSAGSRFIRTAGNLGLYEVARLLTSGHPKILMYHRFSEHGGHEATGRESFRQQMEYVSRHYNPMTLEALCGYLESGKKPPRNTIVVTVDDGYRDFYDIAWPVLQEYSVPATLFATTGFISGDLWLWPDKISWLLDNAPHATPAFQWKSLTIEENELCSDAQKIWKRLIDFLLTVPDPEKHEIIASLAASWHLEFPEAAPNGYEACSWDELREMQQAGIEIGGHTVTHPTLGQVDPRQAEREIKDCRRHIEFELGRPPCSFCYPNGMPDDFSSHLMKQVEEGGFRCAVAAFSDSEGMKHRFALRRHSSGNNWFQFRKSVSGVELIGHRLRGSAREHRL